MPPTLLEAAEQLERAVSQFQRTLRLDSRVSTSRSGTVSAVLAYVFWHVAGPDVAPADYEARLARFHAALREEPPPGLGLTATLGLDAVPWLGGAAGYEDWYLVDDFAALGTLNAAAVSGARKAPHDEAAKAAHRGVAGVMGHVAGPPLPQLLGWAAWLSKPAGMAYDTFHEQLWAALGTDACAWQRQMTLGPAKEYCVLAPAEHPLPWPAQAWPLRAVVAPAG
jgi:hypothetical protein